jgi:hypothetical protein
MPAKKKKKNKDIRTEGLGEIIKFKKHHYHHHLSTVQLNLENLKVRMLQMIDDLHLSNRRDDELRREIEALVDKMRKDS